jgi:hypothetical protein
MNTENLIELRYLRNEEKNIKARIDAVSDAATAEAVAILAEQNRECGEFEINGLKYQLQRTEEFDFANYNRYKGEDAVRWRQKKAAQDQSKKYSSALTKEMKGIVEAFVAQHPDWEPDEVKLTVKCLD